MSKGEKKRRKNIGVLNKKRCDEYKELKGEKYQRKKCKGEKIKGREKSRVRNEKKKTCNRNQMQRGKIRVNMR